MSSAPRSTSTRLRTHQDAKMEYSCVSSHSPSLPHSGGDHDEAEPEPVRRNTLETLGGSSRPQQSEAGRLVVQSTLTSWGIDPADLHIADGSGLSPYDLVTPCRPCGDS